MRQSQLFTKIKKELPKDEVAKNAQLLIKAGFVHKEMAGVYNYLPLGLRVINNIKTIVKEEMEAIGAHEIIMSTLQRKELWETTDRWSDEAVDVWFKSQLKNGTDVGFGWSHEEPIANMMKEYISSYRDLPAFVFQFQTKMRNELRAKSGIMRGREFVMKDMYSFTTDAEAHELFYKATIDAYLNVFKRVGLGDQTFVTFAPGGAFTEYSHEFQTITDAGEDVIYINREKDIAINEEVLNDEILQKFDITSDQLEKVKTAEVGNIFNFGTEKCEQLGLTYVNEAGENVGVHLGSYGIGITRLMGVVVEHFSDDNGLIWPESIAPFKVHLVSLCREEQDIEKAEALYTKLQKMGVDVLYDDRDLRPGQKFGESDMIGIPHRIVISPKTLEQQGLEYKQRNQQEANIIKEEELFSLIT